MRGDASNRVVLADFPLRVAGRAYRHRAALLREFAIIAFGGGEQADVPKRLIEIATILDEQYAGLNDDADDAIYAAASKNVEFLDVELAVPARVKGDTLDLAPLLLEADEYCRNGGLLTLAPSDEIRRFWIWFLSEFVRQTDGYPPRSWRDYAAQF
ncbi:MAG TPA: hypothetical protein VGP92_18485 [Acidimicrobiia bacterium]|jgi:hypothetical protein|nr:hypothetical protein [Acidimicrobiia bacterium]